MKTSLTLILLLIQITVGYAQVIKKYIVNREDDVSGYYLAAEPKTRKITGVLVLLPGFGQPPESIFPETKLHTVAFANDLLVVAVAVGEKLSADSVVVARLNLVIRDVRSRYAVPPDKFVIGGFSAGGTIALRYTEFCYASPAEYPAKPAGVFTVDSPVDLIDLWRYFDREIARNYSEVGVAEAKFIINLMTQEYGSLKSSLANYKQLTPFYADLKEPGNEKHLKNIGVRVYHDVDINWYLKERRRSIYDENFLNSSEMINRLLLTGSSKAEFIQSARKGYRSNGMRHPHAWSIVDDVECIKWVKTLIK